jgi:hypothetical protein
MDSMGMSMTQMDGGIGPQITQITQIEEEETKNQNLYSRGSLLFSPPLSYLRNPRNLRTNPSPSEI